ncbi:hypothetical protein [Rossellomorea aquimaris]|uniref:hypothetical protein n=1 Tax=Rossellomorea aquimaris TaxID=189382 RepID=UPI001CFD8FF2|nr:hypothetical protein [Rossellomorea aquimaris]
MPRKSSKQTRYDSMTQWQQRKEKRKKSPRRLDNKDWTDVILANLKKEGDAD